MEDAAGDARVPGAAPHALVARGEEHRQPARAVHHELRVALVHVLGAGLLDLVVAVRHRLHPRGVGVVVQSLGPVEERVGDAVDDRERDGCSYRLDVLNVKKRLFFNTIFFF